MKITVNELIERNRIESMKILELCNSCPHKGEDCLALDNQCPDQ